MRLLVAALLLSASPALADTIEEAQRAQLDILRAEVAGEIQLHAYDLLDELVYGWIENPPFAVDTPVVLADVSVPVGLGTGLKALVENHFASIVTQNSKTHVVLAHCPQCTAIVVHSGKTGTVVARGVDSPEALAEAGGLAGAKHAIFIDLEAEGASLVLRARITAIEPALPILFARTLSSSASSPALLRAGEQLKSAEEARKEYLDALRGQGLLAVPLRIVVRSYAMPQNAAVAGVAPFVFLQTGVEVGLTQARSWTASFALGYTWTPEVHDGWLAQARISRLISGSTRSLTRPDLYFFLSTSAITIHGVDAAMFYHKNPSLTQQQANAQGEKPRSTFAAWAAGLDLRVKNRIGAGVFLESIPALDDAPSIGSYMNLGFTNVNTIGAEVLFCF